MINVEGAEAVAVDHTGGRSQEHHRIEAAAEGDGEAHSTPFE